MARSDLQLTPNMIAVEAKAKAMAQVHGLTCAASTRDKWRMVEISQGRQAVPIARLYLNAGRWTVELAVSMLRAQVARWEAEQVGVSDGDI